MEVLIVLCVNHFVNKIVVHYCDFDHSSIEKSMIKITVMNGDEICRTLTNSVEQLLVELPFFLRFRANCRINSTFRHFGCRKQFRHNLAGHYADRHVTG